MQRTIVVLFTILLLSLLGFTYLDVGNEVKATADEVNVPLWEQTTAYRIQHATTSFELDPGTEVISGELNLTAYNADPIYMRAVEFYLGGNGGTIGVYQIAPGQVRGEGTIDPGETKTWVYDLSQVMVADGVQPSGYRLVDFKGIINSLTQGTAPIEVQAWVTTFTDTSWITASLDLVTELTVVDSDGDGVFDDVDQCPNENATGLDANGDGCKDSLQGLKNIIVDLPAESIANGTRQSLLSKTEVAIGFADNGDYHPAVNIVQALIKQVNAQQGRKLEEDVANLLVDYANNIVAQLSSSTD